MEIEKKPVFWVALALACCMAASPRLSAQAPPTGSPSGPGQTKPAPKAQNPAPAQPQPGANSFPEDTTTVPVLPSGNTPVLPPGTYNGSGNAGALLPAEDVDPVASPEDEAPAATGVDSISSSSSSGMDNLLPPDNEEQDRHRRKMNVVAPDHKETAAEDENVGGYYLDRKDWRAALSRFQSAMVLDPDNPDVYWGLAESERHLGDFAAARANYQKVMEYDPGSRHAKDAGRTLKEPELANAKPAPAQPPAPQTHP
jgi:hypothetical protein